MTFLDKSRKQKPHRTENQWELEVDWNSGCNKRENSFFIV